ncbi:hypothetical protein L228DRAFT_265554 [Xylona heveae TC161]|uniref:Uncharacterized protein n=1 Tax=Xylona heveae (strain CBS 132557 / TC161) TaxID=1328760 RepID=A0A165ILK8_XYLHT|nr:hypothetical protein L228DRAFT_265554 [Xylona heveae TC161]KZF25070.1 hypothetical protein L228DRAFT_265554 [Xylona heveae TC161]
MGKLRDGLSTFRRRSLGRSTKSAYNETHNMPSLDTIRRYDPEHGDPVLVSRKPVPEVRVAERPSLSTVHPLPTSERLSASPPSTGNSQPHEIRRKAARLSKVAPSQHDSSVRTKSMSSHHGGLSPPYTEHHSTGYSKEQSGLDNTSKDSLQPIDNLPSPGAKLSKQLHEGHALSTTGRSTTREDSQLHSRSPNRRTPPKSLQADSPPRRKPLSPDVQPQRLTLSGERGESNQSMPAARIVESRSHPLPPLPPALQDIHPQPVRRTSSGTQSPLSWNPVPSGRRSSTAENLERAPLPPTQLSPRSDNYNSRRQSSKRPEDHSSTTTSSSSAPRLSLNMPSIPDTSLNIPPPFITASAPKPEQAPALASETRQIQPSQPQYSKADDAASPTSRPWPLPDLPATATMVPPHIRDLRASSAPLPEQEPLSSSATPPPQQQPPPHHHHNHPSSNPTTSRPSRPSNHKRKSSGGSSIRSFASKLRDPPYPSTENYSASARPKHAPAPVRPATTGGQTGQFLAPHAPRPKSHQSPDPSRPSSLCITVPAPGLTDVHFSCYHSHRRMMLSRNLYAPVACMTCGKEDDLPRFKCTWCCLRICRGCLIGLEKCPGRSLAMFMTRVGERGAGAGKRHRHTISGGSAAVGAASSGHWSGENDLRRSSIKEMPGNPQRTSIGGGSGLAPSGATSSNNTASNSRRSSLVGSPGSNTPGAPNGQALTASSISLGPPPALRN